MGRRLSPTWNLDFSIKSKCWFSDRQSQSCGFYPATHHLILLLLHRSLPQSARFWKLLAWKTGKLENWKSIKENSRIRKNKTTINNGMNRNGAVSLLSVCLFLPLLRCSLPLPSVAPSIFACFNMSNFWNLPPWEIYSFDWPEHMLALSLTLFLFLYIYIYIYF